MNEQADSILGACTADTRRSWKDLAVTGVAFQVIAFVVLTPLVGIALRTLLAVFGRSVLTDQGILYFLLGPAGWFTLIVVAGVWIAVAALQQAALMAIVYGASPQRRIGVTAALRFAAARAWPILQVTLRMVAIALLAAAPFLIAAGVVYLLLLTEFDINFYLSARPPAFWIAAALLGSIVAGLSGVLLYLVSGWAFALPLLLFEKVTPGEALRRSRERTVGHRWAIVRWIAAWAVAALIVSAVSSGAVHLAGRLLVPVAVGSLTTTLLVIGAVLLLWGVVQLVVAILSAAAFAALLVNLYRRWTGSGTAAWSPPGSEEDRGEGPAWQPGRKGLLAAAVAAILLAGMVGVIALRSVRVEDRVQVTAHRGGAAVAPENTLAAIERAIAADADWVEIDVQESADGVVMVVHDSDLKKLANSPLKIWETTAEELRKVDIGSSFSPEFADQRIPTLDEVLQACKGRIGVNIELKYYGHDQRLEERVVELVEAHQVQSEIVVMSLKHEAIRKMQSLRPDWTYGLLFAVSVGDAARLDADFLAVNLEIASRRFVRAAHESGKQVHVWTVNDPLTMSAQIGRGVDNLITDNPTMARRVLEFRAGLSPVERLLLELAVLFGVPLEETSTADDA